MGYYVDVLKKYAVFNGRASRKEFWMFLLYNFLIGIGISILAGILKGITGGHVSFDFLGWLYDLAIIIPWLAVGARRLHDTDHSAWWLLIGLIPIIGGIWLIILYVTDGTPGVNKYGPNPNVPTI